MTQLLQLRAYPPTSMSLFHCAVIIGVSQFIAAEKSIRGARNNQHVSPWHRAKDILYLSVLKINGMGNPRTRHSSSNSL